MLTVAACMSPVTGFHVMQLSVERNNPADVAASAVPDLPASKANTYQTAEAVGCPQAFQVVPPSGLTNAPLAARTPIVCVPDHSSDVTGPDVPTPAGSQCAPPLLRNRP